MAGLFHSLNVGAESLHNSRQGVDTAGHNIANAQVEGYSRQRVNLTARNPLDIRGVVIGNGAYVKSITRTHDKFLEDQITQASQKAGGSKAKHEGMKALEAVFSPQLSSSVADEVDNFFNVLQDLSNFPEELSVRTNVKEAAGTLTESFRRTDEGLRRNQGDFDQYALKEVQEANDLVANIARLNSAIREMETNDGAANANDLRDERDRSVRTLSEKMDITYYEDNNRMLMVRGPKQVTLVDGRNAAKVVARVNNNNSGFFDIAIVDYEGLSQRDVTKDIKEGRLGALLEMRDKDVPRLLDRLNNMAKGLVDKFNETHRQGYGVGEFRELAGRDFFKPIDDINDAAQSIRLSDSVLETVDSIATAYTPNAPGDNLVVNDMIRLKHEMILEGGRATFNEYYANTVGILGLEVVRSDHYKKADEILSNDLKNRRESISGVSLDEEAMNMLRWQAIFTASSKVITTADEMIETVLGLKR